MTINKIYVTLSATLLLCSCAPNIAPPPVAPKPQVKTIQTKTIAKKTTVVTKAPSSVLSKAQATARLNAGAALFDARSADEFAAGHKQNAINVPYELLGPTLPALETYKEKEILIVGKNNQQVEAMRKEMLKAGFKNVLNAHSLNS